jgi:hypothetical protein
MQLRLQEVIPVKVRLKKAVSVKVWLEEADLCS